MQRFSEGRIRFDRDGTTAAAGECRDDWIRRWLTEPYFQEDPPKSTGRERFGAEDLERRLGDLSGMRPEDAIATLTGFSAAVVRQDLDRLQRREGIRPLELVVAGGGRRNPSLMSALRRRCHGLQLRSSDSLGLAAEAREALVFALLAWWHHKGHPANAPAITGAARETLLGVRVEPA